MNGEIQDLLRCQEPCLDQWLENSYIFACMCTVDCMVESSTQSICCTILNNIVNLYYMYTVGKYQELSNGIKKYSRGI